MSQARPQVLHTEDQVGQMLQDLADRIAQAHPDPGFMPALVGIRTGGAHLARRLAGELARTYGQPPRLGIMDITLYRDDWTRAHHKPRVGKTDIGFDLEGMNVLLVDDVLFTGRTVRAALDALIDLGRPRRIELAVLIDRGHRELPIQPDYVGARVATEFQQAVDVALKENGHPADQVVLLAQRPAG
jgi:pyrimidine operon attenuation protein / uracil phosphoribosyltransferase